MNKTYILIDEIYPFSDLNMLCQTADKFYNSGINFIVSVMPIYENFDYPAFKSYAQVLRYIQYKGGSIVLHNPIVKENEEEKETIAEKLNFTKEAFKLENVILFDYPQNTNVIVYQLPSTPAEIDTIVTKLNEKWIVINDYKREFTDIDFYYNEITYDKKHIYNQQEEGQFQNFFSMTDRFLVLAVSISIFLFVILILIGHRLYKKKFYK